MSYDIDAWCSGNCMAGPRSRVRKYHDALAGYEAAVERWRIPLLLPEEPEAPRIPFPIYGNPVYDAACVAEIKAKLSRLDGIACIYLREADGMRGQSSEARVSGSTEKATLSPTLDDLDELDGWLRGWRAAYLGVDTFTRQGGLSDSITLGCAWLVARCERMLASEGMAADFGREILSWHARLARFDPADVVTHRKPLRCPGNGCHRMTLEWKEGDDHVRCRNHECQRSLTLDEYDDLVDEEAKTVRRAS